MAGKQPRSGERRPMFERFLRRALAESDQDELRQIMRELPHARERVASSYLYYVVLAAVFILGALAFVLGHVLDEGFAAAMLTELGGVLWTSVVVVFLLEILVERLRGLGSQWIEVVEDSLRDHGLDLSEKEQEKSQSAEVIRLERVLAKLESIERRLNLLRAAARAKQPAECLSSMATSRQDRRS